MEMEKLMLLNIVEDMVRQKVNELIKDMEMCDCSQCRMSASAVALNHLPSHYVTTEKGELLGALEDTSVNYQTNVTVEVVKALQFVKEHPRH